jgi:cardiolipin synthase A/B
MKTDWKSNVLAYASLTLVTLVLTIYLVLVTPRRFIQCLSAPVRYFTRDFHTQQYAAVPKPEVGNQVRLLVNGSEALPEMLALIAGAQESIRWQVMLFFPDEAGRELASALAAASRRGVQVQLSFNIDQTVNGTIADGFSRRRKDQLNSAMQALLYELRQAGVEVRANPAGVDFPLDNVSPDARAAQNEIQKHTCISANHYDHRKLLIFDNDRAVIGGMNVGNHYLYHNSPDLSADMVSEVRQAQDQGQPEAWEKWLDTAFVLRGPVVAEMIAEFDWKWEVLGGQPLIAPSAPPLAAPSGVPVQFLRQRPGLPQIGARFFDLVDSAQVEIYAASPFVSFDPAVEALQVASQRGVRVLFFHPRAHQEMDISRRVFAGYEAGLVNAGIELYYNDLRMVHTKLMVVDRRYVLLGSFNLNHRSFRHDLETAVVVDDAAFARQVIDRVFKSYQSISSRVKTPNDPVWNLINWLLKPFS